MIVGVGTPSDTHFNVTVRPIQDFAADEVTLSISAGSVEKIRKKFASDSTLNFKAYFQSLIEKVRKIH